MDFILPGNWGAFDPYQNINQVTGASVNTVRATGDLLPVNRTGYEVVPFPSLSGVLLNAGFQPSEPKDSHTPLALVKAYMSSYPVLSDPVTFSDDVRTRRTFKEFKRLREQGKIVLSPRRAIKVELTPRITPGSAVLKGTLNRIVGITSREEPTQPYLPGKVTRIFQKNDGIPGLSNWFSTSAYARARLGRLYGIIQMRHYNGVPSDSFRDHGTPNLEDFIDFLDRQVAPPNLKSSALDEAYSGVYDVLTELGELPTTVSYMFTTLRRIIMLAVSARHRAKIASKRFTGKDLVDEISSIWLQFRYAVSPLAYSIEDQLKLLALKPLTFVTTRKREDVPFRYEVGGHVITGTIEHRCFVKCKLKMTALQGMGLNPVKTLWELTPLSFVSMWFYLSVNS